MKSRTRAATGALAAATLALGMTALATPATAADPVHVLTGGLNAPFGLVSTSTQGAIVAQSGAGEVTRISPTGAKTTVIDNAMGWPVSPRATATCTPSWAARLLPARRSQNSR